MILRIDNARPIKPMVVRMSVVLLDNDENLIGEYEIAVDLEPYVDRDFDTETKINVNAVGVQQHITNQVAEMQLTGMIAKGFKELTWEAVEADNDPT